MAITLVSSGAVSSGINSALTPVAGSYAAGDALIYITWEHLGSDSITAPAGWQQLSANSTITTCTIWGRIAQSNSETIPSVSWSAVNRSWAFLAAFRGVGTSFTSVMPGTSERTSNTTQNIIMGASSKLPTQDGCLCIAAGVRNKTSTSDASVLTAPSGWSGMLSQASTSGNSSLGGASYWIQTTATTVIANTGMAGSVADGTTQSMAGTMIFLAPAASSGGGGGGTGTVAFPPPKRKTYIIYDQYYPR